MSLKSLIGYLQSRSADTRDTSEINMGSQQQCPSHAVCTLETSDTPGEVCTRGVQSMTSIAMTTGRTQNLDRWCWPHFDGMNSDEIHRTMSRVELLMSQSANPIEAEAIADKFLLRDREGDDRRCCLECANLVVGRCRTWREAGIGAPTLPLGLIRLLQRCDAFVSA